MDNILRLPGIHYGHAVRLARESRGFTQQQCAKQAGMSQSKLSRIEDEMLALSTEDAAKLSEVLRYRAHFFYSKDFGTPHPNPIHYCYSSV